MKLSELLSELRLNILNDRSDHLEGTPSDQLWSDTTLVRYINEAHRRFATKSLIIRDGTTPEVTQVVLKTGVIQYTLHPSVIAVISAKFAGDQNDLARIGHSVFSMARDTNDTWDPSSQPDAQPSKPTAFSTDEQVVEADDGAISAVSLRLYPPPSAAYNNQILNLRVVRKPLDDFTVNNLSAAPEIPADHHLDMLDWAAYLALRIVDVDAGNAKAADQFRQMFEAHVQEARTMVMRKLFAPKPWGFGRSGWSWGA
jgi:hypothetical protein